MDLSTLVGLGGVPVVIALVQAVKPFVSDDRWWPVLAVGFGVVWNVGAAVALGARDTGQLGQAALIGVVIGLAAAGLYSGSRTMLSR